MLPRKTYGSYGGSGVVRHFGGKTFPEYSAPGFPGEHHAITLTPGDNIGTRYNFLGPGTHVKERMARGDMPINYNDKLAMAHDLAYTAATDYYDRTKDRDGYLGRRAAADSKFIREIDRSPDDVIVAKIAKNAIKAKLAGEDLGILDTKTFSGRGGTAQIYGIGSEERTYPYQRIIDMVEESNKKGGKNSKKKVGGIPPFVIPLLVSAGSVLVDKIFGKLFGSGKSMGAGAMDMEDKKIAILKAINDDPTLASKIRSLA